MASSGETAIGLDKQIDTTRVYREEQLPRALSWETVQAFLQAIDRTTPSGIRDYAIFLLIATYGLRGCDIVALTLDDVAWRSRRLRIQQRKTGRLIWLPLTDEVATALLDYLRRGRPHLGVRRFRRGFQREHPQFREIFLRCYTPAGVLKATAITEAFQKWSRRSGLEIPFHGVHCLRHSYAVHLLRSGSVPEDDRRSPGAPDARKHLCLSAIGHKRFTRCAAGSSGRRVRRERGWGRMMKAAIAFTSLIAPHIERYVTLKQALGREYRRSPSRAGAHRSVCDYTRRRPDIGHFRRMVFDVAALGIRDSPQSHAGRTKFLPVSTPQ